MTPRSHRYLALLLLAAAGCGGDSDEAVPTSEELAAAPPSLHVPEVTDPIADMEVVEDDSEAVANRFVDFADKLRRRDFRAALEWLSEDFTGHGLDGVPVSERVELPLEAYRVVHDVSRAPVVGREGFLDGLSTRLGPWKRVEAAVWKVKGAEFQVRSADDAGGSWGRIRFKVSFLGSAADGGPRSLVAWAHARVERVRGNWTLTGFELESLSETGRAETLFTDVATAAGVAHTGIRFGQPGNDSFAWNGAAGGDADGDGLWDLFVPSQPANFLYMGRTERTEEGDLATFDDEAEARGVRSPGGGTGAAFLDYDNDGDADLALADVGWKGGGNPLRLWRNDGEGNFGEVGREVGFGDFCHGYSLTVFDADRDGFLDVFVCNYGRVEVDPNDSWIQATNGTPNRFYRNEAGERFHEEARARGLVDTSWSYAAAAADYDGDGDLDLYVANDYGRNELWRSDGEGRFENVAESAGVTDLGNGMGAVWGDLTNDGELDLYVSNMSSTAGNRILKRLGRRDETWSALMKLAAGNTIFAAAHGDGGPFELLPPERGGIGGSWAWAPALQDLDLDGRLDVYCCSGFVTGDTPADT